MPRSTFEKKITNNLLSEEKTLVASEFRKKFLKLGIIELQSQEITHSYY